MRLIVLLFFLTILMGCASSAYNPYYIVSDSFEETPATSFEED